MSEQDVDTPISGQEVIPIDSVVASFRHTGEDFRVLRQVHNISSSSYSFLILDKENTTQGGITGKQVGIGNISNFTPISTENYSKSTTRYIPQLMSTSIGEIVLQSEEDLVWHSSQMLSRPGRRMYEALLKDTETEGSRFYGKLKINKWVSHDDGYYRVRYSISKIGQNNIRETTTNRI